MNIPRRHHFVPILYLKNFTTGGGEDDRLWLFDQERFFQRPSTPKNAAHKRDFHKIDGGPGVDPMAVERGLGEFETQAAPVLREIIESQNLPTTPLAYNYFINFIALLANRVPAIRSKIVKAFDEARAKQEFAAQWLRDQGQKVVTIQSESPDQTWLVENISFGVQTILPYLAPRKWSLWIVEDQAPDLICSDNPVALTWTIDTTSNWPPGFGLQNTQVTFPLTRRMLVVGSFEGQADTFFLDARSVAAANSRMVQIANQVYSATEDFVWLMEDGRIGNQDDLMESLKAANDGDAPRATG